MKADAANNNIDGETTLFHEADYASLGVSSNGSKTPVRNEREGMLKERMTSGKIRLRDLFIDPVTGERVPRTSECLCNGSMLMNSNAGMEEMTEEILNRFYIQVFTAKKRPGRDIVNLLCNKESIEFKKLKQVCIERMRRMHCLVILTNELINCGILLPVNTEYSNVMFNQILQEAEKMSVPNTNMPRHLSRMFCAVRACTIIRALLIRFSSPLSPFRDQPWNIEQMLTLGPQLVDDDPGICISVLGFMDSQYYDAIQFNIVEALKEILLPVTVDEIEIKSRAIHLKTQKRERKKQEEKNAEAAASASAFASASSSAPPDSTTIYRDEHQDDDDDMSDDDDNLDDDENLNTSGPTVLGGIGGGQEELKNSQASPPSVNGINATLQALTFTGPRGRPFQGDPEELAMLENSLRLVTIGSGGDDGRQRRNSINVDEMDEKHTARSSGGGGGGGSDDRRQDIQGEILGMDEGDGNVDDEKKKNNDDDQRRRQNISSTTTAPSSIHQETASSIAAKKDKASAKAARDFRWYLKAKKQLEIEKRKQFLSGYDAARQSQDCSGLSIEQFNKEYHNDYYEKKNVKFFVNVEKDNEKLWLLASRISQRMVSTPRLSYIVSTLRKLSKLDIKIVDKETRNVHFDKAIELQGEGIRIATSLCDNNTKDTMKKAIKNRMQHQHTIPMRLIYGIQDDNLPYVCDYIQIKQKKNSKPVKIENLNYFPDYMKKMMQMATTGRKTPKPATVASSSSAPSVVGTISGGGNNTAANAIGTGLLGETSSGIDEASVLDIFYGGQYMEINMPLEHYVFFKHIKDCGWTGKRLKEFNIFPESESNEAILRESKNYLTLWREHAKTHGVEQTKADKGDEPLELQSYPGLQSSPSFF